MKMSLRKIILIVVIILIVLLAGWIIAKGFKIGNLQIRGIIGIIEKNNEIDQKNADLAKAASTTYNSKILTLEQTGKTLQNKKEEYENEAVLVTASGGTGYLSTTEKYEIEFLWTRLGNYAGDEGVDIKIDVTNSSIANKYDLNFTVTGTYVGVTDFIYDIENDSKLGFKIEDFEMQAASTSSKNKDENENKTESSPSGTVQATFSCKQININIQTVDSTQSAQNDGTEENANNTTNNKTTSNNTTTTTTTTTTNSNTTNGNTTNANSIDNYLNQ